MPLYTLHGKSAGKKSITFHPVSSMALSPAEPPELIRNALPSFTVL